MTARNDHPVWYLIGRVIGQALWASLDWTLRTRDAVHRALRGQDGHRA